MYQHICLLNFNATAIILYIQKRQVNLNYVKYMSTHYNVYEDKSLLVIIIKKVIKCNI